MIELADVSFSYDGETRALDRVSLALRPGERTVVLGANGSGKSTLGRLLNGSLVPEAGCVMVDGADSREAAPGVLARLVGYVRQDPRNQIVSALVSDEVAFGPRNLGLPREEVLGCAAEALEACGIADLRERLTSELSGGQQQLLALAGVLAMHPRYLVLDEASSQLDGSSRDRLARVVARLVREGIGVLEIAHCAEALVGADRAVVLEGGRISWEGSPRDLLLTPDALRASGLSEDPEALALGRAAVAGWDAKGEPAPELLGRALVSGAQAPLDGAGSTLAARDVSLAYDERAALDGVSLEARGLTLVLGRSGSGKTTLARVLAGVLEADEGEALLSGVPVRAGMVGLSFQRSEDQLFCDTVADEISYGPRMAGERDEVVAEATRAAAAELGVEGLLGRSPFELSGGQMRRVALAAVVAARPAAYVLDEPTAGLDAPARRELRDLVTSLVRGGAAVVVVTHDAAEWLDMATRVAVLAEGRVVASTTGSEAARSPGLFERAGLKAPLLVRARAALEGVGGDA